MPFQAGSKIGHRAFVKNFISVIEPIWNHHVKNNIAR